jgi:aminoglycoside 3-N-acetyltransferase
LQLLQGWLKSSMSDYSKADLKAALDRLPLERGDVVFCHSNLGFFGRAGGVTDSNALCEMFFDCIMERLGPNGTLCVPTFTYSFPRGEVFDWSNTPSKMGMFAEWVRTQPLAYRSLDPCYSVAMIGTQRQQRDLVVNVPENSFDGMASFFVRFLHAGGKVLNLNFDAGSTFVHWVERELQVPYRFDKTFSGVVRSGGTNRQIRNTIWVRYLDDALEARFEAFDAIARERGVFRTAKLGRGEMGVISADETGRLIVETLPKRPWFLTKAEVLGVTPYPVKFRNLTG